METLSHAPHAVPPATRDGWTSFGHGAPKRRTSSVRALRRRRPGAESPIRDAFVTWRARPRSDRFMARLTTLGLAVLAAADLIADGAALRMASWIAAVLVAGAASLLAVAAAEPAGIDQARRWHLQAVASAVVMFMLMANGTDGASGDLLWFVIVVGAASTLVAMATSYREGVPSGVSGVCLALDAGIVGFTTALITVALASAAVPVGGAAILGLSWLQLEGRGTRAGFFGMIVLFGLIVSRLLLTLVENRQLLQRVERSGLFEEKLRDLGGALVRAMDRKNTLELVCRTAQ